MRIVIAGGSGQMGQLLTRYFAGKGDAVTILSRGAGQRTPLAERLAWDGRREGVWVEALEGADVLINLSGRSVDCRYTERNRREILESRVVPTKLLREVVSRLRQPPPVWLNASTATIYRHIFDRPMDEANGEYGGGEPGVPRTWNYSVRVAREWEAAFFEGQLPRTRRVALRTAILLSPDRGSVFEVLSRLVRLGAGGRNGAGRQFVSWIEDEDFVRAVGFLIQADGVEGPVNLAAPHPLPNNEFMRGLREAWGVRLGLPAPEPLLAVASFVLRTEPELVLKSRRVVPGRLLESGFQFEHPEWPEAARRLVARWKARQKAQAA